MSDANVSYLFTVSRGDPDAPPKSRLLDPFITCESRGEGLSVLKNRNIGFVLHRGTTQQEAEQIARYLNDHIEGLCAW